MIDAEKLVTIAGNVPNVYKNGYDVGYAAGQEAGGGGDSYYDEFWDSVQQNGSRTGYVYGFAGESWTDDTFKPKYNIEVSQVNYMFYYSKITDLQAALDRAGVVLDLSNLNVSFMIRPFDSSQITRVGEVNLAHVTTSINTFFANATKLVTIDNLKLSSSNIFGTNIFQNCTSLKNITIEGEIGNDLNMSACPLTTESVQSVIEHLIDLTGQTAKTLTLSSTVVANLTTAQTAMLTAKNWKT